MWQGQSFGLASWLLTGAWLTPGACNLQESLKANLITATAASGLISTALIGLMGNLPLALAPGIGITTYVAYHVVGQYGQGQVGDCCRAGGGPRGSLGRGVKSWGARNQGWTSHSQLSGPHPPSLLWPPGAAAGPG